MSLLPEPKIPEELSDSMKRKLPKKFNERHEQAFQYYLDLGASRNFQKVAAHMKVSATTIANWSIAYGWTDRLRQEISAKNEEGLISHFAKIASVRNDGISVIETIMGILRESVEIINAARSEKRLLSDDDKATLSRNKEYLFAMGFKVTTGKDLRDFVNALGEIVEFGQSGGGGKKVGTQPGLQVSGGSVLILQGLTTDKAKEILQGDSVPALRGSS